MAGFVTEDTVYITAMKGLPSVEGAGERPEVWLGFFDKDDLDVGYNIVLTRGESQRFAEMLLSLV